MPVKTNHTPRGTFVALGAMLFALVLGTNEANGAVFHVSTTGSNATGDGSQAKPWATIARGVDAAQPGDTVLVGPGTFPERISTRRAGTADGRIEIRGSESRMNGFIVIHPYHTISGFEMTGAAAPIFSGTIAIRPNADYLTLHSNNIHDLDELILGIAWDNGGRTPDESASFCNVYSNKVSNIGGTAAILYGRGNLFYGNVISNFTRGTDAFRMWGTGNSISNNVLHGLVEGGGGHPDIIQTFTSAQQIVESYGNFFEANYIADCAAQLCMLENDNPLGATIQVEDWTFRNNIYINVKYGGQVLIPNTKWYNNLFYRCGTNTLSTPHLFSGYVERPWNTGHNAILRNNIYALCGVNPANALLGWYAATPVVTGMAGDYNYVFGTGGAPKVGFLEAHGINGGWIEFENPPYDLRVKTSSISKLRGKGVVIPGISADINGAARSSEAGKWDIGPYSFFLETPGKVPLLFRKSP